MIKQIEYENKQAIQNDDSIANKNKVTAEDMNEIKNVVNQNAKELEILQEDNQGNETAIETLQNDISLIKQNNSEQDKRIQSNTSKIEAINKNIEAINNKNTEQDTNIQKNAKDIEVNQNNIKALQVENAEVKAENERLRSDIESISLLGQAEGESIDLDDSSGARFNKFGIGGNHSQETREGIQLLNIKDVADTTVNGITYSIKNGKITLNGTSTARVDILLYASVEGLDRSQSYAFNAIASNLNNLYFNTYRGGRWNDIIQQHNGANKNGWVSTGYDSYYFDMNISAGATFNNFVVTPMFCKGTTIPSNYEQYGATPSLEFPSEIKTVKDNVNEVVCNKNLFKETSNKKEIKTAYSYLISGNYMLKKGKKYAVSFDTNNNGGKVYLNEDVLKFIGSTYDAACDGKRHTIIATAIVDGYQNNRNLIKTGVATTDYYDVSNISVCEYVNNSSSDFVEHQEQTITMPVQQEMLQGDYIDWENEKEIHKWLKVILDGTQNLIQQNTSTDGKYRYAFNILTNFNKQVENCSLLENKAYCDCLKMLGKGETNSCIEGFTVINNVLWIYTDGSTLDEFKTKLANNQMIFYIPLASNDELDFTDEQKVVAKKIKETLHTYKNITHIYSTDEISPIMNVEYAKDLNTQNNNLQNQIDEIKQLISTTQTSAMLLDNLQKEVESEVE